MARDSPKDEASRGDVATRPRRGRLAFSSSVRTYIGRLGTIHERQYRVPRTDELLEAPYRVFEKGYIPLDAAIARRLDWLISQYLLEEHMRAAEALASLESEILRDQR